jgi:hypothetical protein
VVRRQGTEYNAKQRVKRLSLRHCGETNMHNSVDPRCREGKGRERVIILAAGHEWHNITGTNKRISTVRR